jgi:dolichyl-phosphate-mannose--protein O-mannosyl transferase
MHPLAMSPTTRGLACPATPDLPPPLPPHPRPACPPGVSWNVGVGLALGASVSVKWTGLATPGLVAIESFFALWFLKRSARFVDLLVIAGVVIAEYHLWFYLHFWALNRIGDGDAHLGEAFQVSGVGG